ncbi:hypothetical protein [Myceligenerans indicum]|uniref:ATP-binding protein n=1 Tax=Myceligenerans indicum TaxID=2593663 RepID=A0ABS1LM29_9MICO|nr:hypothetical protein [Myceligenerans indicum]MBL0887307.1 hypothetical protein [Myceligenerans indicum]
MKHVAPKKKAGAVPVSRTIATVAIVTAAAGAATPAMAAELPHSDLGLDNLPTTDIVDLPDHDALVSGIQDVVAGPRGADLPGVKVPGLPADLADLGDAGAVVGMAEAAAGEAQAVAEGAMPASIAPVEQVAPNYSLPGFAGQGDAVQGALAAAEAVKGTAESATRGAPQAATAAAEPVVQGVMSQAGGVTGVAGVVDGATGATGVVDGAAGAVSGIPGDDIVGGVTGQVEDAATGVAPLGGVLGTAAGVVG